MTFPLRSVLLRNSMAGARVLLGACMLFAFAVSVVPTKAAADQDDATVAAPSRVKVKDGIVTLTLDAKTQRKGGIVSAPASTVRMRHQILGFGTVLDSEKITALHDTYRAAKARLQTAKANLAVSRAAYDRAKTLFMDSKEIPVSQLESKQGTFQVDRASLATAQSRVATVTANMYQLWGGVLGKALIDGTPLAADLIERRAYIVKVTLPPGAKITPAPKTVSATLDDGTEIPLSYISSATTTDPAIQGISYFYETPATDGVLPGLNVFASFKSPAVVKGVQVPASAVVWLQGKAWIYLRTGPETFTRREISPDRPSPHGGYVVTGLPGRANIVVVGAQMLLSEEFRAQTAIGDQD